MKNKVRLLGIILGTFISLSSCGNNIKSELTTVLPAYLQTLKDNLGTDTLQDFEKSPYYNRLYKKRKITEEVNEARDLMWINGIDSCFTYDGMGKYETEKQNPIT